MENILTRIKESVRTIKIVNYYLIENTNNHRTLTKDKLIDIQFIEYETPYCKRKKVDEWVLKLMGVVPECQPEEIVELRRHNPTYVFESGFTTTRNHQIYFIAGE